MMRLLLLVVVGLAAAAAVQGVTVSPDELHCVGACQQGAKDAIMNKVMPMKIKQHEKCVAAGQCPTIVPSIRGPIKCVDGKSAEYDCKKSTLMSFVSTLELGTTMDGSDIWGWTDPETKREIAIVNVMDGTSFVDITDATDPTVVGFLPTETLAVIWRDVKVIGHYAYIGSEAPKHGMQVFDLTRLPTVADVRTQRRENSDGPYDVPHFKADAVYKEFGRSHNIVANTETDFVYAVGTATCSGGLHMVNVTDPLNPTFAGCFAADGYTHDAQCVVYNGPDTRYSKHEICFCYNEDSLTIVDVSDKKNPVQLGRQGYVGSQYTHQGWLNDKQSRLIMNDELDEANNPIHNTRSMVWDVEDLKEPKLVDSFWSELTVIDHNLYIHNGLAYEANYCGGLRVLDTTHIDVGKLSEVAYFDVAPDCNTTDFQGAWSVYPYFSSGNIVVNSIERGLFVVRLDDDLIH